MKFVKSNEEKGAIPLLIYLLKVNAKKEVHIMNMQRIFRDIESEEYITETQLKAEFKQNKQDQPEEYENVDFECYIKNCLWQSGGTLEFVGTFNIDIFRDILEAGNFISKNKITVAVFRDIQNSLDELLRNSETSFVAEDSKRVFEKYGFKVTEKGVGWKIRVK